MCIQPGSAEGRRIAPARDHNLAWTREPLQLRTPPGSVSGNLSIRIEGFSADNLREPKTFASSSQYSSPRISSHVKLPSIGEFVQGVEELARTHGPVDSWTPLSPLPSISHNLWAFPTYASNNSAWPTERRMTEESASDHLSSRRGTITSLGQYALAVDQASQSLQGYNNADDYYSYGLNSPLQVRSAMGGYPSPPPESESRHINQKYTTEEGDFIIYAWHDKKMKWQRIKQEFARMFGRTPERTVQGLQAWYYRMNLRIPVWDEDGWLCFENEDDLEPIHVPIKCRERDSQDKPAEREIPERPIPSGPLGLAQRYPERAMLYAWVDQEFKRKAQDWASKRELQYHERRERRRRKEQRRLKL